MKIEYGLGTHISDKRGKSRSDGTPVKWIRREMLFNLSRSTSRCGTGTYKSNCTVDPDGESCKLSMKATVSRLSHHVTVKVGKEESPYTASL